MMMAWTKMGQWKEKWANLGYTDEDFLVLGGYGVVKELGRFLRFQLPMQEDIGAIY